MEGVRAIATLMPVVRRAASRGLARADQGFAEAYPDLFRASMRLAHRMTRDAALAEDVAAEALARAYCRWSHVSGLVSPAAWVQRVTANLVIDAMRRQKVAASALPVLSGNDVIRLEDQVTVRLALVSALATLPPRQREALVLRYLAGVEEPDLSQAMGTSPSTVRTHVQRGLLALRERLAESPEVSSA